MMFHQPCSVNCDGSSSEVRKRPSVGTSQSTPTITRMMWIGAFPTNRRMRWAVVSCSCGSSSATVVISLDLPPEAANVQRQDRNHEHEEEDGDRGAVAEVADAAERGAPHVERDHVRVVLH